MRSHALSFVFLTAVTFGVAAAVACGSEDGSVFTPPGPDAADAIAANPTPTGFSPDPDGAAPLNFPADPIIDGTAPASSKEIFGGATFAAAGGPCLMEPEVGSMLPRNWLRPRFHWVATDSLKEDKNGNPSGDPSATPQTLFELRVHAAGQPNNLVVYTTNTTWTMPRAMWDSVRAGAAGTSLTMTVRGGTLVDGKLTNASAGSSGPLAIAPVEAPGTIVYWTTASDAYFDSGKYNPVLKGFHVGDESVRDVLHPEQVPDRADGKVKCVGCHTSTPDGTYTVSSTRTVSEGDGPTSIGFGLIDGGAGLPPYVSPSAKQLFDRPYQAAPSFSPAHFKDGDRVAVTMLRLGADTNPFDLIWTDLEAKSTTKGDGWGVFARTGDGNHPAAASVSHDGSKIVYISTETVNTSGNIVIDGDLYTIPWNNRQGGAATELTGANQAGSRQFYPAFSPDDSLVAFNRAPMRKKGTDNTSSYDDELAELYVIPSGGATRATRLAANNPPACSGSKSPGTFNSWPKWSPDVGTSGGNKYYFIVFSSARNNGAKRFGARLYVTPVVVDTAGNITTYSALYLWNQPETEDNHSPAWDTLAIPDEVVK